MANQDASRDMTAAQRFFALPELVNILCTYCSTERVDLIALASVSKYLRAIALPHWVKHLDLALSIVDIKLKFFIANPALLSHIRFLRIRDDYVERKHEASFSISDDDVERPHGDRFSVSTRTDLDCSPHWDELKLLLAMIAAKSSSRHRPPAIDITIDLTQASALEDAFRLFPRLQHQTVALRILLDAAVNESMELQARQQLWQQNWVSLARFFQCIHAQSRTSPQQTYNRYDGDVGGSAPGLRLFHLGHAESQHDMRDWWEVSVPVDFWTAFSAATASSLRDLSITLDELDLPENIFPLLAHSRLARFALMGNASSTVESLEGFLDQNQSTLEDLHIEMVDAPESLTLRQTFPKLRYTWCEDTASSIPPERRNNFAQRHPQLEGILERKLEGPFSREICPTLRVLWALPTVVEKYALEGRRISHVSTFHSLETLHTSSWLTRIPDAARAITCLELFATDGIDNGVPSHLSCAFSSDLLPNLTELSIEYRPNSTVLGMSLPERDLARYFFNLCSAKYLRVLHLDEYSSRSAPFENTGDLLAELPDARFPSCLEYFSWHVTDVSERHYYRFVPSQEQDSPANGSKRGRLQRISPLFCTPITKEGVWERAFDTERRKLIYDHTPLDGPVMRLS